MNMYTSGNGPVQGVVISGRAARTMSAVERAMLAADIRQGRVSCRPTLHQLEAILGVSTTYIVLAQRIAADSLARAQVRRGAPLAEIAKRHAPAAVHAAPSAGNGANGSGSLLDEVVALWELMTPEERTGLGHRIGPARLWEECLQPAL